MTMEETTLLFDTEFWISVSAIAALLILSGFFSGSETALTAASRGKLRAQADKGSRSAQRALDVTEDSERLIGSVLLGNNLVNILATSLTTALLARSFGESAVVLTTLVMTVLVLIFAEVLPKTYAITNAESAASLVSRPIQIVTLVFNPIVSTVLWVVRAMLRLFGVQTDPDTNVLAVREEIAGALRIWHSEGIVEKEDRDRILGALDLEDRTVNEIMLHRSDIEMVNAEADPMQMMDQCLESNYTRLPMFKDNQENIIGVLHAKDLARTIYRIISGSKEPKNALQNFNISEVAKTPYFVPDTTTLDDQMREFLRLHLHFALVVDEYGTLQGLITLEDILEEIVGEITDEFDEAEDNIMVRTSDGHFIVEGSMTIRDFNRATDCTLPDQKANTIAGLVIHESQTIPTVGQVFSFHGFRFEVTDREGNRITELKMRPLTTRF
ncbi:MAG: Magnesium and cobalt efflux protein CorC [Alphaproteobacteria bacterium MarineAlpha12_Bin1]|nr:MAG: Magnesium and cobalt efflux protein CorC [Alphaproteobacteria bacterium MarineAlpha12_Bin1]|tara:strand:- start:4681 stop:6006 length:1326 start_codon:yes stop_codon:yes gene_type:complete